MTSPGVWLEFSEDYDYRWESRSVTAFKAGMKVYVKRAVADAATADGVAREIDKPDEADREWRATPSRMESIREQPASIKEGGATEFVGRDRTAAMLGEEKGETVPTPDPDTLRVTEGDGGIRGESIEETVAGNEAAAKIAKADRKSKEKDD